MKNDLPNICIIDDDPITFELIKSVLSSENVDLFYASSADEGLDYICSEEVDLVLLDILMPDVDGLELLKKVRNLKNPVELPIVMITALNRIEDVVSGLVAGANDYCTKPVHPEVLKARINTQLELSRLNKEILLAKETDTLNQLITTLNHEINNPLTVAIANLKSLDSMKQKNWNATKDSLERIKDILKRIHSLTEGRLQSKPYAGKAKLYKV